MVLESVTKRRTAVVSSMNLRSLTCFCLFLLVPLFGGQAGQKDSALNATLARLEQQFGGHLGVAAKNLRTGEWVSFRGGERFPTASVIKLPIMAAFFDLMDREAITPLLRIVVRAEDKKPGLLQLLDDSLSLTVLDAVTLMIVLSENTATNLVLDRLAPTHAEALDVVNTFLARKGMKQTRLLNRLYSPSTKQQTPEALRYGIGVMTPEEMVLLLAQLFDSTLASPASCRKMMALLKQQEYNDMLPRLLPRASCKEFAVAHKTGWINETKADVGLVLTDRATYAVAIVVDKHPDHQDGLENNAVRLAAHASRAVWNFFTGDSGFDPGPAVTSHVDWNWFPGGKWGIFRSSFAPFPSKERANGVRRADGTTYPFHPHYDDSSIVVVVPSFFTEGDAGTNLIVHFHGHMSDNLMALERYRMPQALIAQQINAVLVLPQGPYRAPDSFAGKLEESGGFRRMIEDVLATLQAEGVVADMKVNKVILSAHSGGYRAAAYVLDRGGMRDKVSHVFLFDAFYGNHDVFAEALRATDIRLLAAYTPHLAPQHEEFISTLQKMLRTRVSFTPTAVDHDEVVHTFFTPWLAGLGSGWQRQ